MVIWWWNQQKHGLKRKKSWPWKLSHKCHWTKVSQNETPWWQKKWFQSLEVLNQNKRNIWGPFQTFKSGCPEISHVFKKENLRLKKFPEVSSWGDKYISVECRPFPATLTTRITWHFCCSGIHLFNTPLISDRIHLWIFMVYSPTVGWFL